MYILIVTILCVAMLGGVYYMAYQNVVETIVVSFLLFTAIDTTLRAILDEPSWVIKLGLIKKRKV